MKEPAHLALHPFGQIPTYEEGDLALFETGAIVFHIAERHAGLLPDDADARARAITWMFAALNTVEPPILKLATGRAVRLASQVTAVPSVFRLPTAPTEHDRRKSLHTARIGRGRTHPPGCPRAGLTLFG
jgi:glutathione S-transferase